MATGSFNVSKGSSLFEFFGALAAEPRRHALLLDVGCNNGRWAARAMKEITIRQLNDWRVRLVLFEPQEAYSLVLSKLARATGGVYEQACPHDT